MSLVGKVGRRRFRARLALFILYFVLTLGAVTTLYPFLLMVSTGFKGPTDQNDNKLIPAYWSNSDELYKKYVDDKYAGNQPAIDSSRIGGTADQARIERYEEFLAKLPVEHWSAGFQQAPNSVTSRLVKRYQSWLRDRYEKIDNLNIAYIEENTAFETATPPGEQLERKAWKPSASRKYTEWLEFKSQLPVEFRIPVRATKIYQDWTKNKYQSQFDQVPKELAGSATRFEELTLPTSQAVWEEFRTKGLPDRYQQQTTEALWAMLSGDPTLPSAPMPIEAYERGFVAAHADDVKGEFTTRNYVYVLNYILLNGRAVWNTLFFCFLAILTQLTVNPLAAYALSRYPIKASGQILIFLLATMAFPAEVALIPSFLLLKDLNLLNSFAALVLPTAASGYMIFLLKGFFDSLPQELFEAGQLDGAKETTMMLRIAFPLSKPVLGYLALIAFMASYGAFIYAFLVAQDQRMWTLMVWIYQLQSIAPKAVMMAAVTLAAIPTLFVFLLAQRVIMRGIVLPGER
jgi:multiple sugar transport system permease protein